jgi:hypothetical protein
VYQRRYQFVASKWTKAKLLMEDEKIRNYLPETRPLTYTNLTEMLELYPMLYLKPDNGMKGEGIIRIVRQNEEYQLDTSAMHKEKLERSQVVRILKTLTANRKYVIQQGVKLLSSDEHPIDFRVLMQKPTDEWVYCGIVGKLGERKNIVTNHARGGKAISFKETVSLHLTSNVDEIRELRDHIRNLCFGIASQLTQDYPGLRELGIDIAIDEERHVWILEVNTTPGHALFRNLQNGKIYQRIVRNIRTINENT